MIRRTLAALALAFAPAVASAQLPTHNVEATITDADPVGQCSDGREWWNSSTGDQFDCYGGVWVARPAGASFPLAGTDGCTLPPYAFTTEPTMGLCRGLAATWGFDSLVLQTSTFDDFAASFLQMHEATGFFTFMGSLDLAGDGSTIFTQAPIRPGTPWSNVVLNSSNFQTGTGAFANVETNAADTGIGFFRVTIDSDPSLNSVTNFLADETTFTDPIRGPVGSAAAPSITGPDPTTGIYFAADERIDFATNGVNRFILSEAGPSMNATFSLFGSGVNTFTVNVSDSGHSGILRVTTQTTNSEVDLSSRRSGDAGRTGFFAQSQGPRQARLDVNASTKISALDDRVHVLFPLDIGDPVGAQPTCDSTKQGWLWKEDSALGVADTFEICAKDSSDVFAWFDLATIP